MNIEFTQTVDGFVNFYVFNGWLSPERKIFRLRKRTFWGVIAMTPVLLIFINNEPEDISYAGVLIFGLVFFTLGFTLAGRATIQNYNNIVKRMLSEKINSDFLGHVTFDFQPDRIVWKGLLQEGVSRYEIIKKIAQDNRYYYLYNNSLNAWVIPKAVFKNESQTKEFEKLIRLRAVSVTMKPTSG